MSLGADVGNRVYRYLQSLVVWSSFSDWGNMCVFSACDVGDEWCLLLKIVIVAHGAIVTNEACTPVSQAHMKMVDIFTCVRLTGATGLLVGNSIRVLIVVLVLSKCEVIDDKQLSWSMPSSVSSVG